MDSLVFVLVRRSTLVFRHPLIEVGDVVDHSSALFRVARPLARDAHTVQRLGAKPKIGSGLLGVEIAFCAPALVPDRALREDEFTMPIPRGRLIALCAGIRRDLVECDPDIAGPF